MKYGLYTAASGTLTAMHRQDILATNLANANTVGFKPDVATMRQSPAQRELTTEPLPPQELLERLGGVVQAAPTRTQMTQGLLQKTGNALDLAIDGDGFFVVQDGDGPEGLRLTRDGRFTLDQSGRIVSAATGRPLESTTGGPIVLQSSDGLDIDNAGTIRQNGDVVGQIRVAGADPADLKRAGEGMFRPADPNALTARPAGADVRQHMVEASAVDPITTMTQLMGAAKAAQSGIKMMQFHDYLSGQAINVLARV